MAKTQITVTESAVYWSAKKVIDLIKKKHVNTFIKIAPKKLTYKNPEGYCLALKELLKVDKLLFKQVVGDAGSSIPQQGNNPLGYSQSKFFESIHFLTSYRSVNTGFFL